MSPSAAVTSWGSFSASAASKYAITSCFAVRYSAASHGSIPLFPMILCSLFSVVHANRNLAMGLATVGG